jgi:hypothetical protein
MKILIRKLKMEVCWTILRYFSYQDDLELVSSVWDDQSISDSALISARSFEIKKSAEDFLITIFNLNSTQKNELDRLDVGGIEKIFSPVVKENEIHWCSMIA